MNISQIKRGVKVRDEYGEEYVITDRITKPFKGFTLLALTGDAENYLFHHLDWDASDYDILPEES